MAKHKNISGGSKQRRKQKGRGDPTLSAPLEGFLLQLLSSQGCWYQESMKTVFMQRRDDSGDDGC